MEASFSETMTVERQGSAIHSDRMVVAVQVVLERVAARALQSIVNANPDDPVKALHGHVLGLDLRLARLSPELCREQYPRIETVVRLSDQRAALVTLGFIDITQRQGRILAAYGVAMVVESAAN